MITQPDACIVRITNSQGETLGTGFLVSADGRIATCAHVVKGTQPHVAFPDCEPRPAQVVATDAAHDVTILRVEGDLPPGAAPARLGRSADGRYHDFRSRGYRLLGGMEGIPAEGRVLDAVSECPGVQHKPLVLQTQHVRRGMSGAPIYVPDLDLVVGMITSYWDSLKTKTGFSDRDTALATPSEAIAALCPDIRLGEPCPKFSRPPLGVPFQAPAVPRYFVPRPEVSQELEARLLADEATAPGALVVSTVHGLGGIGKTTLVAALAHDPDLQARFSDGVLWVTLGQQPDVLSLLAGWIRALGDYDFHPTVTESASSHLRTLLHDKACLLVVDDAWRADHVRPFLVGGECCRVLVVTRDAALARKVGAQLYDLDVMTEDQAMALFEARLGALDGDRELATALARELGYLPLALELAAAQVEAGASWDELLAAFRQGLADLAALDLDEATFRNESLRLSFRLSLEQLSDDDLDAFVWLGVLPEDVLLNPAMAATLWDQAEADARKRLRRLRDKALLKPVGDDRYTIHDLLHDEAKLRLAERMPLSEAHAMLLDRYRQNALDEQWHCLPDDGYVHAHLTWHMEQAGQPEEIHALLRLETPEGRNAWYQAKSGIGDVPGFLTDLKLALRHAASPESWNVGRQIRYALIESSIRSFAGTLSPKLLAALIDRGRLDLQEALRQIALMPKNDQRVQSLTRIAPLLVEAPRSVQERAFAVAKEIPEDQARSQALVALVAHLPDDLKASALAETVSISYEPALAFALSGLLDHLPDAMKHDALTRARRIKDESARVRALTGLIDHLQGELRRDVVLEALMAARNITAHGDRAQALVRLVDEVPQEIQTGVVEEALDAVRSIEAQGAKASVLTELVSQMPRDLEYPALRHQVLRRALTEIRIEANSSSGARALVRLMPYLSGEPEELRTEALAIAQSISANSWPRAEALSGLTVYFTEPLRSEMMRDALETARAIADPWSRAQALKDVAGFLPNDARTEAMRAALEATKEINDESWQVSALHALSEYLPEELANEALTVARGIADPEYRASALDALIGHLPRSLEGIILDEALTVQRRIGDRATRAYLLSQLIGYLPTGSRTDAMREVLTVAQRKQQGVSQEWHVANALCTLADHLPLDLHGEALNACSLLTDESARSQALSAWVSRMPAAGLAAIQKLVSGSKRGELIAGLAPYLSGDLLKEAFDTACEIEDEAARTHAVLSLTPYLSEKQQKEVFVVMCAIQFDWRRAEALTAIANHVPRTFRSEVLRAALKAARAIDNPRVRVKALGQLIAQFSGRTKDEIRDEAISAVNEIDEAHGRTSALVELAEYLTGPWKNKVLQRALLAAESETGAWERAKALLLVATGLPVSSRVVAMRKALQALRALENATEWQRIHLLTELAGHMTHLSEPSQEEVMNMALSIVEPGSRVMILNHLAAQLPIQLKEHALDEALRTAQGMHSALARVGALWILKDHLSGQAKIELFLEAFHTAARAETHVGDERALYFGRIVSAWAETGFAGLGNGREFWYEMIHILKSHPRSELLLELAALAPLIDRLGGEAAIPEVCLTLRDIGRWWP